MTSIAFLTGGLFVVLLLGVFCDRESPLNHLGEQIRQRMVLHVEVVVEHPRSALVRSHGQSEELSDGSETVGLFSRSNGADRADGDGRECAAQFK